MSKPLTRDGVEFHLGMTLINYDGIEIPTDEWDTELELTDGVWTCRRRGLGMRIPVALYFSSHAARVRDMIARLEEIRLEASQDINILWQWLKGEIPDTPQLLREIDG